MVKILGFYPVKYKYNVIKKVELSGKILYLYYDEEAYREFTQGYKVYEITEEEYNKSLSNAENLGDGRCDNYVRKIGYLSNEDFKNEEEWLAKALTIKEK